MKPRTDTWPEALPLLLTYGGALTAAAYHHDPDGAAPALQSITRLLEHAATLEGERS